MKNRQPDNFAIMVIIFAVALIVFMLAMFFLGQLDNTQHSRPGQHKRVAPQIWSPVVPPDNPYSSPPVVDTAKTKQAALTSQPSDSIDSL